jgi:hypothetical protein
VADNAPGGAHSQYPDGVEVTSVPIGTSIAAMPPPMPSQVPPQPQTQPRTPACVLKPPRPSRMHISRPLGRAAPPALSACTVPCSLQRCPAPHQRLQLRACWIAAVRSHTHRVFPAHTLVLRPFSPLFAHQSPSRLLIDVPKCLVFLFFFCFLLAMPEMSSTRLRPWRGQPTSLLQCTQSRQRSI